MSEPPEKGQSESDEVDAYLRAFFPHTPDGEIDWEQMDIDDMERTWPALSGIGTEELSRAIEERQRSENPESSDEPPSPPDAPHPEHPGTDRRT